MGLSRHAAELYLAALETGPMTMNELSRAIGVARTALAKPIGELVEAGLFLKTPRGKRLFYSPANPQELPSLLERKKQALEELAASLLQQISAPESDIQVRWYSGISGIQTATRELFRRGRGNFRQFENADTYEHIGVMFGKEIMELRIKQKRTNKLIIIGTKEKTGWYADRLVRQKDELREVVAVSSEEYPFHANIALTDNMTLIFEYKKKPFALLIDNLLVTQSLATIHQMVWERYRA